MSETKLISPLPGSYMMGGPISSHHGVNCHPAMQENSDAKYIIKVVSVPASGRELDALLLTGAFSSREDACAYFLDKAQDIVKEAELLTKLSSLEGFVPYKEWGIMESTERIGYEVHLAGDYRLSLERFFRRHAMTHLKAINLGLDLCAALAVCRRLGYLYVALKPSNVFVSHDQEYRIGDLGFVSMSALAYTSLPDKYRSVYTPPEITDAYSELNTTMDTYAAGLILYQAYNNGLLPFEAAMPEEPLPPPLHADAEMAQIILKACAYDPAQRWQDPVEMGQAIVDYMQKNGVSDTLIDPTEDAAAPEASAVEETADDSPVESAEDNSESSPEVIAQEAPSEDAPAEATAESALDEAIEELMQEEDSDLEVFHEELPADENVSLVAEELAMLGDIMEQTPAETEAIEGGELTEEAEQMLALADELIAHEAPDPVVAPEAVEVEVPPLPQVEQEPAEEAAGEEPEAEVHAELDAEEIINEVNAQLEAAEAPAPAVLPDEPEEEKAPRKPRRKINWRPFFATLFILLLLTGIAFGGYYFYENYYVQTIDGISLSGYENKLTVMIDTDVDEALLTIVCADTHGTTLRKAVVDGKATFNDLSPDTHYKIQLEISGFHKLIGVTSHSYNTPALTTVSELSAITGQEDGSVILSFNAQGATPSEWTVIYGTEGEESKEVTFTGQVISISGLTVGKTYTFRLQEPTDLYLTGEEEISFTAQKVILPQDLQIDSLNGNQLAVSWKAPEGADVESWTVRCYITGGFDQTFTVTDTKATIELPDRAAAYTIEVTAAGMTVQGRTYLSANTVTLNGLKITAGADVLNVTWGYEGTTPDGGWHVLYTINGGEKQQLIQCSSNSAQIELPVPSAKYEVTVLPANGATVFNNTCSYETEGVEKFSGYWLTADDMEFKPCVSPGSDTYDRLALNYTDTIPAGEKLSVLIRTPKYYTVSYDTIETLYVVRDANGFPIMSGTQSRVWVNMWHKGFCLLTMPVLPATAGQYSVDIYFNGMALTSLNFNVA